MRINKYVATTTGLSRRRVDTLIDEGRVLVNNQPIVLGTPLQDGDKLIVNDPQTKTHILTYSDQDATRTVTIVLNKPVGYVCSREGQGNPTVYDLLPKKYNSLKLAGRLDKDSSGLVLLTNNGELLQELTHPKYRKNKIYQVTLHKPLQPLHQQMISDFGVRLDDGNSKFIIQKIDSNTSTKTYQVTMQEGRNRQIRRTFESLGYTVTKLNRTNLGSYSIGDISIGKYYTS